MLVVERVGQVTLSGIKLGFCPRFPNTVPLLLFVDLNVHKHCNLLCRIGIHSCNTNGLHGMGMIVTEQTSPDLRE